MNQSPSPFFRKFMIVFASVICVFYLAYRAIYTFNLATPYAVFASVFLYVGEFFGIMNLLLYFLQAWEVSEPPAEPVLEGRTVDVLVPTYNEDPALLRATLEACIRMDYPHKTFVLDDGRRPEVEALANELGVIYISRPDNRHAKAGNLNNALEQTDSEFVVVLDADHVPEPHFITRLIGYFRDDQVAFVQTPHAFYNFDSFQARLDHKNRRYWEEGDLFYRVIQPGRNKWNAPIFAGSAAMFRRTSLREIGYIATETITEDLHTGLRLHARGWKSIAISERLIAGQAPPDIKSFHAQRLRWGEGNLSIMAYDNPLVMRGLSPPQRLCYFGSMIHWASGLFKLAIYLTPILMLFSGVPPVREFSWDLIVVTFTYLFFSLYAMKVVSNGYGSIVNSELFSMVNFWTQIKATFRAMFRRQRQRFVVTQKGTGRGSQKSVWPYVRPQTYLIVLSVLAIFWGWLRLSLDLNPIRAIIRLLYELHFEASIALANGIFRLIDGTIFNHPIIVGFGISDDYLKPVVPTIWCLIFFWIAYKVTQRAFWPADRRFAVRHQIHLPVEYEVVESHGTTVHFGVTVDLNDSGMAFVAYSELPMHAVLRFTVRGAGEVVKCKGEIRSAAIVARGANATGHRYGVQFLNLTPPQIDAINRMCLHYAVPRMFDAYERGNRNTFFNRLKLWQSRGMAQRRAAKRHAFSMPIIVNTGSTEETTHFSATEDVSRIAAAAMFDNEIPSGTHVGYLLPTPLGEIRGTANVLRTQPVKIAGRTFYRTVLEFQEFEGQGRTTIQSLVNPNEHASLGAVLKPDRRTFLPKMKLPILVGLLIALPLILAQMGIIFPFYYKDDEALKKMYDERRAEIPLTESEMHDYKRIFAETMKEPRTAPTDRLVLLMNLGNELLPPKGDKDPNDIRADLEQVTLYLAVRDPANMGLSTALVHAYRNTHKYPEAEKEYNRLLALSERGKLTADRLQEVKLAGARIAVDSRNFPLAIERFGKLFEADPKNQELRNEYAGICIQGGQIAKAIDLIKSGDAIDVKGRKLLIAAYMANKDYGSAANEARTLAKETDNSEETLLLQADIERERKDYLSEIDKLTQLRMKQKPQDPNTLVKLAQAMTNYASFGGKDKNASEYEDKALAVLNPLMQQDPPPDGVLNVFVEVASKIPGIEKGQPNFNPDKQEKIKKQALALFQPAYDSNSTTAEHAIYLTRLGWVLQRVGEGAKSSILVKHAVDIKPQDENIRQQLAGILLQQGRAREALEYLGTVQSPAARKLLWGIYVERKEFDRALEVARTIAENDRTWAAEKDVADILSWKGDYSEAIKIYEKHIQEKGQDEESEARIAEISLWGKFYNDAVARYQALLDTEGRYDRNVDKYGDGFINAAAGAEQLTQPQVKLAEKIAEQKLKAPAPTDPDKILALSRLAWIMIKAEKRDLANTLLNKIQVEKEALPPSSREEIAGVFTHSGRFKDAIRLLDNPKTDEDRLGMAKLYLGAREWKAAEDLLQQILDSKPNEKMRKTVKIMLADVVSYKGDHDRAIDMFKALAKEYPTDTDLPIREAEVTLWSKRYDQALSLFLDLYDRYPTNTKVWSGFASAVAALGANNFSQVPKVKPFVPVRYLKTLDSIARRLTNDVATDSLLLSRLALAMHYADEPQKAGFFANQAIALKPRDAVTRRDLSNTLSALGRHREAIDLFMSVEMTVEDRRRLIDIATAGEQMDVAVREARYLVNQDPTSRKDRRILAEVLSWRGDFAESLKLYENLMKDQPKDKNDLLAQMAQVTVWWKRYPEALIRYGELLDLNLEEPRVLFGFIDAAASAPTISPEQRKQCLLIYEKVKNDLKDPDRLSRLAWVMLKLNQAAKADPLLERAAALNPQDTDSRKELAGALTSRLFPKDPVEPEAGVQPVSRKWLIKTAVDLFGSLDPDQDFDTATRLSYITLLIASEKRENLELAEKLLTPLYATAEREDFKLRIRYGEVLLWAGKYDPTPAKYKRAQNVFKRLITDVKEDLSQWKELATIRLGQAYLWAHEYDRSLPIFEQLMRTELIVKGEGRERDIWMGYVDSLAGRIGEAFRLATSDRDLERIRRNLFTPEQKKLVLHAYGKLSAMKPDVRYQEGDPEYYSELLEYYAGTAERLSMELEYMDERNRARLAHRQALNATPDQVQKLSRWNDYARTLMNVRDYTQARRIIDALMKQEVPDTTDDKK